MYYFQTYFIDLFQNKYAEFGGRARREEYWYFTLFWLLIIILLGLTGGLGETMDIPVLRGLGFGAVMIFVLASILPYFALISRRLHDTGKSAWWWLIRFVPLGPIVLLVFYCLDSERGPNKWGPSPKYNLNDEDEIYDQHLLIDDDLL